MGLEVKSSDEFTRSGAVEGVGSAITFSPMHLPSRSTLLLGPSPPKAPWWLEQVIAHIEPNMRRIRRRSATPCGKKSRTQKAANAKPSFRPACKKRLEAEKKIQVHNDVVKQFVDSYTRSLRQPKHSAADCIHRQSAANLYMIHSLIEFLRSLTDPKSSSRCSERFLPDG